MKWQNLFIMVLGALVWIGLGLAALNCKGAEQPSELDRIVAEKSALEALAKRLTKEVQDLKDQVQKLQEENQKLRAAVEKLGGVPAESGAEVKQTKAPSEAQPSSLPGKPADGTTKIAQALTEYIRTLADIHQKDATSIQKHQAFVDAAKKFDAVLRTNRLSISFTVNDVKEGQYAESGIIKVTVVAPLWKTSSGNAIVPILPDRFSISAPIAIASKISKGGTMTIEGFGALKFYVPFQSSALSLFY